MITDQEIEHIASLAKITLPVGEKKQIAIQISTVLEYFTSIQQIDTRQIEPTFHGTDSAIVLRQDIACSSLAHRQVFENTTNACEEFFVIPKVLNFD